MADAPPPADPSPSSAPAGPPKISFDDFKKLDLRLGKILSVKDHPDANKLYLLEVDLGAERRQLVAGVKPYYRPEELVGQTIVVVANLQPAQIRGAESNGMMLAATTADSVAILTPDPRRSCAPGQRIS